MRRGLLLAAVLVLGVGAAVAAQSDAPAPADAQHYTVRSGDTSAMAIARRLCGPDAPPMLGAQIHAMNRDLFTVLNVGEILHVPTSCPEVTPSTTVPPSPTTGAPATTVTSLPATTSSAPPSGVSFAEDFATAAGFYDRFDYGWSGGEVVGTSGELQPYHGDHDEDCHGPDTQREITYGPGVGAITPTNPGKAAMFWWCAPGGDPAKGHMMTGLNTLGYTIIYFSPKQTFTDVTRVCWDQNTTSMDSHWTNVVIVPLSDVAREQAESETGPEANRGDGDLGFDDPEFQATNGPTTFVVARDGMGVKVTRNRLDLWEGDRFIAQQFYGWVDNFDKATRYRHCMTDTAAGVTLTAAEPDGTTRTRNFPGVDFPRGEVRVVFEDANYDAPKRAGYDPDVLTWHWDNILVTAGQ